MELCTVKGICMDIEVLLKDLMIGDEWGQYVTQKQRDIYLKTQTIQTNTRKAIEMNLEEWYEIKGWIGRGVESRRIILKKRPRPLALRYRNANLRNNQVEYKETLLQMTYLYFSKLSDEDFEKGYIENISSNWLQQMRIINQDFDQLVPKFIPDELDGIESKSRGLDFSKEFKDRRKKLFRDEFLWIKDNISYITFEEVYVGIDTELEGKWSEKIRDLTFEEVTTMKSLEEELVSKYNYKRYGILFNEWMEKRFLKKFKFERVWKVFRVYKNDIDGNKKNYQIFPKLKMTEYEFLLNFQTNLYLNILRNEFFMGKDKKKIIPYDFTDQLYISELGLYLENKSFYQDDAYYFLRKNRELLKMTLHYDGFMKMSCNGVFLAEKDYLNLKGDMLSNHNRMQNNEIVNAIEGTLNGDDWELIESLNYKIEDFYSKRSFDRYLEARKDTQNDNK